MKPCELKENIKLCLKTVSFRKEHGSVIFLCISFEGEYLWPLKAEARKRESERESNVSVDSVG